MTTILWICVTAMATLLGCTLWSDFGVHQCQEDAECDLLGASTLRCNDGRCVEGCSNNLDCASTDPRHPLCQPDTGRCVGLLSDDGSCYASTGHSETRADHQSLDDLAIVGAFAPTLRSSAWLTIQLAVDELNEGMRLADSKAKSVVAVLCGDTPVADQMASAVRHLTVDLRSPAILASLEADALRVAFDRGEGLGLFLSPHGATSWSSGTEASDLLWYLGPDYTSAASTYDIVLQHAVERYAREGVDRAELRVANVSSDALEDQELADAVMSDATLAGLNAMALEREGRYARFVVRDEANAALESVANYRPHIVLWFIGGAFRQSPYRPRSLLVERLHTLNSGTEPVPFHVLGPRNPDDVELAAFARRDDSFRARAIGIRADRQLDTDAAAAVATRFSTAFPAATETDENAAPDPSIYDSFYYLGYALLGAQRTEAATVDGVSRGLANITDRGGERVNVGPAAEEIGKAASLLERGLTVNLHGTTGPAEFDERKHTREGVARTYCWQANGIVRDFELGAAPVQGLCGQASQ